MCGLVYRKSFTKQDVIPSLISRYEAQRARGKEGYGAFFVGENKIYRSQTEAEMLKTLRAVEAPEVLFHHRQPTSTDNTPTAAHPFTTGRMFKHNYVLAHNGIIWNDIELQEAHAKERGIEYTSIQADGRFNDSESLLWEMAMYLEGITDKPGTVGGAAFIVIEQKFNKNDEPEPYKLHFGRNKSNSLWIELDDDGLTLASEHWPNSDKAEEIMPNFLYTFNYRTKVLSLKPMELEVYTSPPTTHPHGRWEQGRGWVEPTSHHGWKPQGELMDEDEEEYYAQLADGYSRKTATSLLTPRATAPESVGDAEDELEKAADDYLADMMDKYGTMDEVEWRLTNDLKRARQAVSQLGDLVKDGKAKSRTVKKYVKYLRFSKVCARATAMYTLIADDETEMKETANVIRDVLKAAGGPVDET